MAQAARHPVYKSLYLEVSKVSETWLFRRWVAEWRSKDDPTYHEMENCASSDAPLRAYGWSREKAIKNAQVILQNKADLAAIRIRKEREIEETLGRVKIEIDVADLRREQKLNG